MRRVTIIGLLVFLVDVTLGGDYCNNDGDIYYCRQGCCEHGCCENVIIGITLGAAAFIVLILVVIGIFYWRNSLCDTCRQRSRRRHKRTLTQLVNTPVQGPPISSIAQPRTFLEQPSPPYQQYTENRPYQARPSSPYANYISQQQHMTHVENRAFEPQRHNLPPYPMHPKAESPVHGGERPPTSLPPLYPYNHQPILHTENDGYVSGQNGHVKHRPPSDAHPIPDNMHQEPSRNGPFIDKPPAYRYGEYNAEQRPRPKSPGYGVPHTPYHHRRYASDGALFTKPEGYQREPYPPFLNQQPDKQVPPRSHRNADQRSQHFVDQHHPHHDGNYTYDRYIRQPPYPNCHRTKPIDDMSRDRHGYPHNSKPYNRLDALDLHNDRNQEHTNQVSRRSDWGECHPKAFYTKQHKTRTPSESDVNRSEYDTYIQGTGANRPMHTVTGDAYYPEPSYPTTSHTRKYPYEKYPDPFPDYNKSSRVTPYHNSTLYKPYRQNGLNVHRQQWY